MGIRLAIVDDNPHVTWAGRIHPVNATFQQFAAGLLDLPGTPVASITSCVPLRAAEAAPITAPLDPRIRVVGSAPFDGIGGYLRRLPGLLRANRPVLARVIRDADLVWLKVPASNAGLATAMAVRADVPRFAWVAGSAEEVAAGRYEGVAEAGARVVGVGYDLVGRLAGAGGHRLVVGDGVVDRGGIVASLVEPAEIRDPDGRAWPPGVTGSGANRPARLAWAGRLVEGKGLEALISAVAAEPGAVLELLGDGPAREALMAAAETARVADRVTWAGLVGDRTAYLDRLATADAFVFPSPAEGFPKVILDAFAVGLPILATRAGGPSGGLADLIAAGLVEPIGRPEPDAIVAAWRRLLATDPTAIADRRRQGAAFASAHSRPAEAAHLVERWRDWWPALPWGG